MRWTYILKYRTGPGRGARQRWYVIGRHGSPDPTHRAGEAPVNSARAIAGAGADPSESNRPARRNRRRSVRPVFPPMPRVGCRRAAQGKFSVKTIATDRGRNSAALKPLLGRMTVAAVGRADIERLRNTPSRKARRQRRSYEGARSGAGPRRQRNGKPHGGAARRNFYPWPRAASDALG